MSTETTTERPAEVTLKRFNPRRALRGVEAAEVEIVWEDGNTDTLWMSVEDLKENISLHGPMNGYLNALYAYKKGVQV